MRYVIIGAGALGTLIAARLARHDADVRLVEPDAQRRARIERGVTIGGYYRGPAVTPSVAEPGAATEADALLLCVPPSEVDAGLTSAAEQFPSAPPLVSFVGGIDQIQRAHAWPGETVFAVTNLEVRLDGDGDPETGFHNFTWLGNLDATETDAMRQVQHDLAWVGPMLTTKVIHGMTWSKAVYLLEAALPPLIGATPLDFYGERRHREAAAEIVREGLAIAAAHGVTPIAFDFFDPNLYAARTPGERAALDAWMLHAWQRHEQYRVGSPATFTEPAGIAWSLAPDNPTEELTGLLADLGRQAATAGLATPRLDRLETLVATARCGGSVDRDDVMQAALDAERA
jgi:ketopantoate reductase